MARAVLEGVAYNLRMILDAFRAQGVPIAALRVIGGGARSAVWRQILADVLDMPLSRPHLSVEATSLGAAIAGGVGVGLFDGYGIAETLVSVHPGEEPVPDAVQAYHRRYPLFAECYRVLAPLYDRLAALEAHEEMP
jgi:xylulokinase